MKKIIGLTLLVLLCGGCASPGKPTPILSTIPSGNLTWSGGLPVLHCAGSAYEMGYQHGSLMRSHVRASVANAAAFADRAPGIPLAGKWIVRQKLDRAWRRMAPFVPPSVLEEMKGLADGAGVPLKTLQRIHAMPEFMSTTCSSFAAFGKATADGRLIQMRNLDWAIQSNVQRYAALFVQFPEGGHPFVSVGWLGFVGAVSGINQAGISVAEIGAKTVDQSLDGVPMPFLLRRVLEESDDLDQAARIIQTAPRTGGYNYLFADAKAGRAVVLETTKTHCALFTADQEPANPFAVSVVNAIFRSDWALSPEVREKQLASRGDPTHPGLESPEGSTAYDVRYRGQGLLLRKFHGRIDPEAAMAIARAIAPSSNIQSVVYAYPQMWVATASGRRPAAMSRYHSADLRELFDERQRPRRRNE